MNPAMTAVRRKTILVLVCILLGIPLFSAVRAELPLAKQKSCTSFRLFTGDRSIVGKNLDWSIEDGILSLNPRGLSKRALVNSTHQALEWVSVYASISFNQFGREFPLGGMNEAGLIVEELSYWPSRYPPPDERPSINELQWIQYQLDVNSSVAEVVEHLPDVPIIPMLLGLHYMVVDESGDSAVIEFLDGELIVHRGPDLPVPVLTNDTYQNSVRYLSDHVGFGGTRVAGDGPESPERFVRAATMLLEFEQSQLPTDPVTYAFQILRDVAQKDTQWSIVYDAGSRIVWFATASVPLVREINLSTLNLDCSDSHLAMDLGVYCEGDVSEHLLRWTPEKQGQLIADVFQGIAQEGLINDREQNRIKEGVVRLGSVEPRCTTLEPNRDSHLSPTADTNSCTEERR